MLMAYVSDRIAHRASFATLPIALAIAGFSMLLTIHGKENRNIQYGALFLITCGTYSAMPIIICWYAMNLSGHKRRAIGTGWQIGFGNSKSTRNYHSSTYILTAFQLVES